MFRAPDSVWRAAPRAPSSRYDGQVVTSFDTPRHRHRLRVWGLSETICGRSARCWETPGFAWRYDGSAWTEVSAQLPTSMTACPSSRSGPRQRRRLAGRARRPDIHWDGAASKKPTRLPSSASHRARHPGRLSTSYVAGRRYGRATIRRDPATHRYGTRLLETMHSPHNVTPKNRPLSLLTGVHMPTKNLGYAWVTRERATAQGWGMEVARRHRLGSRSTSCTLCGSTLTTGYGRSGVRSTHRFQSSGC